VKASPESCAFDRGRSGGQQVRKPLVREGAAVLPLSVQAATSPSGRWAIPRSEATAKPVAADRAYAAHLGREGVRPIGAVVETKSRKASTAV
jgi:hypothetical protein